MLLGFNHNIRYRGQIYHVQTEDSGLEHPHVITHLFVGGTILATLRLSYADLLGTPDLADRVRERMQNQHKDMLRALTRGQHDAAIAAVAAVSPAAPAPGGR